MNIKHRGVLYALGGIVIGAAGGAALHAQRTLPPLPITL